MKKVLESLSEEKNYLILVLKSLGEEVNNLCENTNLNLSIHMEQGEIQSSLCDDIFLLHERIKHINDSVGMTKRSLMVIRMIIRQCEKIIK